MDLIFIVFQNKLLQTIILINLNYEFFLMKNQIQDSNHIYQKK